VTEKPTVKAKLTYRDVTAEFEGNPDSILSSIAGFLSSIYPNLELVSQLHLTADAKKLLEDLRGVVAIQPDGPIILTSKKHTFEQTLSLLLAAAYAGAHIGLTKDALTVDELMRLTGKTEGSVTGTLSRMKDKRLVEKTEEGGYRITPLGVRNLSDAVLPNLKGQEKNHE